MEVATNLKWRRSSGEGAAKKCSQGHPALKTHWKAPSMPFPKSSLSPNKLYHRYHSRLLFHHFLFHHLLYHFFHCPPPLNIAFPSMLPLNPYNHYNHHHYNHHNLPNKFQPQPHSESPHHLILFFINPHTTLWSVLFYVWNIFYRPARTNIHQLNADIGFSLEDLSRAMDDKELCAISPTW